jgi:hypothetical protein
MAKIRISELPYLASASAGVVLPVVDNGVTYKTDLNVLETAMIHVISASIDNRLDFLESFSSSFNSFSSSIDIKIAEATNEQSLTGFVTTASFNTFTSSYLTDSASFDSRIQNHISSTAYISESYNEFVYSYHSESSSFSSRIDAATNEQYIAGLLLTSSYQLDSASFNNRINNFTSSVAIDTSSFATTGSNIFYGDQIITSSLFVSGTTEFGGDLVPKEARGATLGTELRPFKGIFVSSGSINIASDIIGEPNTSISNVGGNLEISAGGMKLLGSASFIAVTGSFQYLSGSFNHIGTANRIGDTIITGSLNLTGSTSFTELTGSLSAFSASVDSRFDTLESFSSSADNRYVLSGSITQTTWDNIANKPNDIVSSSTQISALGFVTGAYTTINSFNNLTQSFNSISQSFTTISGSFGSIDFSGINAITSSYLVFTQSYYSESASFDSKISTEKNRIDAILSASNASTDTFAEIVTLINSVDLTNDNAFASFYTASNSRITSLENATSSYLTSLNGAISSSAQVLNGSGIYSSSAQLPNNLISGSSQITALGFDTTSSVAVVSASAWGAFQSASSYSSSVSTSLSLVSSSLQTSIATLSSSVTTMSSSIDSRLDSIESLTASLGVNATTGSYGSFYDTTTQSGSANTAYPIKLNSYTHQNGISLSGSSMMKVSQTGVYDIEFSAQLSNGAGSDDIDIWLRKNGTNVDASNTRLAIPSNQKLVAAWNWVDTANANDYYEIMWSTTAANVTIYASGSGINPTRPTIPSVIATIHRVDVGGITYVNSSTGQLIVSSSQTNALTVTGSAAFTELTGSLSSFSSSVNSRINTLSSSVDSRLDTLEATIISGSPNYTQVLGNQRVTSTSGTSIISGSITTSGNPVQIIVTGDANPIVTTGQWCTLQIYRDNSAIGGVVQVEAANTNENQAYCVNVIDTPSAGTYTYSLRMTANGGGNFQFGEATGPLLTAVELRTNTNLPSTNNTFTGLNRFNGQVTLGAGGGDEGGELHFATAETNTTLSGSYVSVDIYRDRLRIFDGAGGFKGAHLDISKLPDGITAELMWKVSGFVNAGTFLTLDNLKVSVTTGGSRGLSVGAVSTNFTANVSGWFGYTGGGGGASAVNVSYTTTASNSAFGWSFGTEGDGSNYIINDRTNNRVYRVTLMIGGGYLNNFISIERLY